LNRTSCGIALERFFATLFYAQVDPLGNCLRYVGAGDGPALLVHGDLREARQLESTGTVLGLSERARYAVKTVPFREGDTLVACTDGIRESLGADGAGFAGRVLSVLRADPYAGACDIAESILDVSGRSAHVDGGNDDRTVVVLRFTGISEDRPAWASGCATAS
jgi:phosphoserine phosphatase RsbU/P